MLEAELETLVVAVEVAIAFFERYPETTALTLALEGLGAFDFLHQVGKIFDIGNSFVTNVLQAYQRVQNTFAIANQLAAKTLHPYRIEVSGVSDDAGVFVLGGSGEDYRNDFQVVPSNPNMTVGTSQFFDSAARTIAVGSITNINFYDLTGAFIHASATISLTSGFASGSKLGRDGIPLLPPVYMPDQIYFPNIQFSFFPTSSVAQNAPNGSFNYGLNGFTTTGNVSLTTAPNGQTAVQLTEGSPSSLATDVTIPHGAALLIFDFSWLGNFTPHEDATFSVDFIGASTTTHLFQALANDESLHSSDLLRMIVSIPSALQGQHGVIRFLLNPSPSDGIISAVLLGGFDIVSVPPDTTPPVIAVVATPETLWPPNGEMVPVTVSGTMTDNELGGTGVDEGTATYAVTDEYGSYAFTIQLQASRNGDDKDGRQYIITVSAQDNAGNTGSAATGVTVPHDQGH